MQDLKKKLHEYVEAHKNEAIELFQSLIRINSVNHGPDFDQGDESEIVQFIENWMKPLDLEINTIEPHPKRPSITGRKRGSIGKPTLCMYGHLDTVPVGDPLKWKYPPFGGEIHDGRLYGRGASDIKQGIATSLFTTKTLIDVGVDLKGDILLAYGAGEETLFPLGLKHMIDIGMIDADYCLYPHGGVPDDPERPFGITLGHRGNIDIQIKTIGKEGHMARKANAINAIEKMAPIVQGIASMDISGPPHDVVPPGGTISVNMISGGIKSNIIPPECSITIDCRFGPGIKPDDIVKKVNDLVNNLKKDDPKLEAIIERSEGYEASWTEPDDPFVEEIKKVYKEFDPKRSILARGGAHSSDSKFFRLVGIPTAMAFAPSASMPQYGGAGHQYNEYAGVKEYIESVKMQTSFVINQLY